VHPDRRAAGGERYYPQRGAALDHNLNSAAMNTYSASKIKKNV
jgi:hypothetical protein